MLCTSLLDFSRTYCTVCLRKTKVSPWGPQTAETERNLSVVARHNAQPSPSTLLLLSRNELSQSQLARLHISNLQHSRSYTIFRIRVPVTSQAQFLRNVLQSGGSYRQMSGVVRLFSGLRRVLKVRYLILTGAVGGGVAANQVTWSL